MLSQSDTRLLHALKRRKHRDAEGLFVAEGVRVVEELVASGAVIQLALVSMPIEGSARGAALAEALARRGRVEHVRDAEIEKLASTQSPQGVLAVAAIPRATTATVRFGARSTCLLLDAVQDPGNFGTLVRSADAFRVDAVVALPGTVDAWNPKSVRAAAGSSFRVPILDLGWGEATAWLRPAGFRFLVADAAGTPVESVKPAPRAALVVGNEGAGVSAEAQAAADQQVAVPISGPAESLNVGVAAGILLYVLTRSDGLGFRVGGSGS